ncbi:MAG: hypothetical protein EZS28_052078, partial [Streblomastix strix]
EIQIFECTLTMYNSGSISRGLVDLRKGTLTVIYLNAYNITLPNGPLFKPIQTAGLVSISGSQFTSIQRSDAGGSVISRVINGRYDGVNIRTSQFTSCSVSGSNQSGGAININIKNSAEAKFEIIEQWEKKTIFSNCSSTDRGGAIFLDLESQQGRNFDLRGARYSYDNNATNGGRSIFINAQGDLRIAVPENQGVKIGAGLESYEEFNLDNLMGYHRNNGTFPIPLYYMYTPIGKHVFHVKDPCTPFVFGCGDDNVGCGHNQWPYIQFQKIKQEKLAQ